MCQPIKGEKTSLNRESCTLIEQKEITPGIFEFIFKSESIALKATAGQFVNLYCQSEARLLPRPISICHIDKVQSKITLVYAVVGEGTQEIATWKAGDIFFVLGPLGRGFTLPDTGEREQKSLLVAGGVGTPPMVELAKTLRAKGHPDLSIYLGFRTTPYLIEELKAYGDVYVATDDGSFGQKGNVVDLLKAQGASGDFLYSCGPKPMLRGVQAWAKESGIPCELSLEERMGCGFGVCVGCVTKIKDSSMQGWSYKKVCVDGPVFQGEEVLFED